MSEYHHTIDHQAHFMGVNVFCKKYGLNRPELMRIIEWGGLAGISILDGHTTRVFIDNGVVLAEAKARGFTPVAWVARLARFSKK